MDPYFLGLYMFACQQVRWGSLPCGNEFERSGRTTGQFAGPTRVTSDDPRARPILRNRYTISTLFFIEETLLYLLMFGSFFANVPMREDPPRPHWIARQKRAYVGLTCDPAICKDGAKRRLSIEQSQRRRGKRYSAGHFTKKSVGPYIRSELAGLTG
jgi:hypothetical protein